MSERELEKIFHEYMEKIERFYAGRVYDENDRDDLVQDTLCAIIESYGRFRNNSSVSTWVYSICRNRFYNYLYKKERQNNLFSEIKNREKIEGELNKNPTEEKLYIEDLLKNLPKMYSKLYELFYEEGYKIKEIARYLRMPEGTVKYLLHQLRQKIRGLLQ